MVIGSIIGIICGLGAGLLTRFFFFPLKNDLSYKKIIGGASVFLSMCIIVPVFFIVYVKLVEYYGNPSFENVSYFLIVV